MRFHGAQFSVFDAPWAPARAAPPARRLRAVQSGTPSAAGPHALPLLLLALQASAFALYLAALIGIASGKAASRLIAAVWAAGCILHGWSLLHPMWHGGGFAFTFFNAVALTTLLINALVLAWAWWRPTWHLGLIALPCALAAVWVEPAAAASAKDFGWNIRAHILLSLLAYGALTLAGAQALMLLMKEHYLGPRHMASRMAERLPPLDRMEALLVEIIVLGLILLTLGLAVGGIALTSPFVPGMLHKTVFSLLAWSTLVALLWGRWRFGWRGRLAAGMTLAALGLLVLGFLGTKFVLEIILNRPA